MIKICNLMTKFHLIYNNLKENKYQLCNLVIQCKIYAN